MKTKRVKIRYRKNFCFLVALALVVTICFWPRSCRIIKSVNALCSPVQDSLQQVIYEGTTQQGDPYILKAQWCQKMGDGEYHCFKPLGEVKKNHESFFISSDTVYLHQKNEKASFEGNVNFYVKGHFSLTTEKATLWYKKQICESHCFSQVHYHPYQGHLEANKGFLAYQDANKKEVIKFRGETRGVMSSKTNS